MIARIARRNALDEANSSNPNRIATHKIKNARANLIQPTDRGYSSTLVEVREYGLQAAQQRR